MVFWYPLTRLQVGQESSVRCCEWKLLSKHHAQAGGIGLYQGYFQGYVSTELAGGAC